MEAGPPDPYEHDSWGWGLDVSEGRVLLDVQPELPLLALVVEAVSSILGVELEVLLPEQEPVLVLQTHGAVRPVVAVEQRLIALLDVRLHSDLGILIDPLVKGVDQLDDLIEDLVLLPDDGDLLQDVPLSIAFFQGG